jgi:hypothetical protein
VAVVKSPFFLQPSLKDRRCLSVCPVQDDVMDAAISNEIIYHEASKFHDRSCVTFFFRLLSLSIYPTRVGWHT